jgi:hypothetical protein
MSYVASGQGIHFADVDGDDRLDLAILSSNAGTSHLGHVGIHKWNPATNGWSLIASRFSPTSTTNNLLGHTVPGQGLTVGDFNDDGISDLVLGAGYYDYGGTVDTGALFWWRA